MSTPALRGMIPQAALLIGAFVAFISAGIFAMPFATTPQADMHIEPGIGRIKIGDVFTVQLMVDAETPVNVFRGEIFFDPTVLQVDSIDYNTSIADLWAELPWYENGDGTLNFTGGTAQQGGFQGTGSLITITFRSIGAGVTALKLDGARILAHDGLGSDVALGKPIDAVFEVGQEVIDQQTVAAPASRTSVIAVSSEVPSTDLNGDGKQSIADMSIFMLHILSTDSRYDFNQDGKVNNVDLSILMSAQ